MSETRRVAQCPAFVLHRRPYRETSLIVDLFTRDHGRVAVVARGGRGPRSSFRGALEPFQPLLAGWVARSELGTLTAAERAGTLGQPAGEDVFSAFYINELVLRLLRKEDPHPALFDAYRATLVTIAGGEAIERALRLFEKQLLEDLGYGLNTAVDVTTGETVSASESYVYHLESGPEPAQGSAYKSSGGELVLPGASLLSLHEERLDDADSLRDAKRLLRAALALYLDGRPLKVREVARAMRR
ncbi:MAG: DNA repair protein RecO [Pseudomonadota bacterium]